MIAALRRRRPAPSPLAARLAERVAACRAAEQQVDAAAAAVAEAEARLAAHLEVPAPSMFAPGSVAAGAPRLIASLEDRPLHPWIAKGVALEDEVERRRQELLWAQAALLSLPVLDWRSLRHSLEAWADVAGHAPVDESAAVARDIARQVSLLAEIEGEVESARKGDRR